MALVFLELAVLISPVVIASVGFFGLRTYKAMLLPETHLSLRRAAGTAMLKQESFLLLNTRQRAAVIGLTYGYEPMKEEWMPRVRFHGFQQLQRSLK